MRQWLFDRLGLAPLARLLDEHKVPPELGTRRGWMYVLGLATLAAFLLQLVTGAILATMYIPSPAFAHESLIYITEEVTFGRLLRGVHYFGASAMVTLVLLHMARVYLTGSYKFPREMNWITGVLLLVLTFAMALTGQLLRWDQHGMWTVVVAAQFAARVPLIGAELAEFILAGPTLGGATLTRFFALHVFVLPGAIIALVGLHLYLLLHHGISEPPSEDRPVDPKTYRQWYERMKAERGVQYWPFAVWREVVAATAVVLTVLALAAGIGPRGPGAPPDPTALFADPRPDWYLRWYYALLWIKPRGLESFVMVYAPLLAIVGLLLLPLLFPAGPRTLSRRPWAVGVVGFAVIAFVTLTAVGLRVPWEPAYETEPLTAQELGVASGELFEGAQVFHERGCQFCHQALGRGGTYGPDLTRVVERISPQEIAVRTVVGFGDMPAYRGVLTTEELDLILAFLRALPRRADELGH